MPVHYKKIVHISIYLGKPGIVICSVFRRFPVYIIMWTIIEEQTGIGYPTLPLSTYVEYSFPKTPSVRIITLSSVNLKDV